MRLFFSTIILVAALGFAQAQPAQQNPVAQRIQAQIGACVTTAITLQANLEAAQSKIAEQAKEIERLKPKKEKK